MSFAQLISILRARWVLVGAVVLGVTAGVLGISLILPYKYTATASVVLDVKSADPITGLTSLAGMSSSNLATQVDIIESDHVARRVVQLLKLDQNAELAEKWEEDTNKKGELEAWLGEWLKKGLDVKPSAKESNVIDIHYSFADPRFAAIAANAFVRAYQETTLELRVEPAKQYSSYFDQRLKQAREQVEAAQSKLSSYQKERGFVATDERLDVETSRLNELSAQLVMLRSMSAETNSRVKQSQARPDQLQDVLQNSVVAGLKADAARADAQLQQLSSRLGDGHPSVIELRANIASLRARIESETQRVTSSVGMNNAISQSREAEVQAAYDAQRAKILKLKAQRDAMSVMDKEVEGAQRTYDAVYARLTQSNLESQNTQTNVSVLNPATEPYKPTSPRPVLYTLIAFFVGCVLAVFAALLREILDKRVRTPDDVVQAFDLPVLGFIPKTNKPGLLRRGQIPWVQQHVLTQIPRPSSN